MTHQRDLERDQARAAEHARLDITAPGRASASATLHRPDAPIPSGIVMRKARDSNGVADGAETAVAAASSSGGSSLPEPVMRKFEASLGTDLSSVRVHTGGESANAAGAVGARAYTVGQDIHFGAGQYDPSGQAGQHLLAHEVAHTVQQRGGTPTRQHKLEVSSPHDAAEHEADRAADAMVAGAPAEIFAAAGTQRQVFRGMDENMEADKQIGEHAETHDAKVEVISNHSVVADEGEARNLLGKISGSRTGLKKLIGQDDKYVYTLGDNAAAAHQLEQYLMTLDNTGNFLGEFQASYHETKKDYGGFVGTWTGFLASGGKLGAAHSLVGGKNALMSNPAFQVMFQKYEKTRDKLRDGATKLQLNQDDANGRYLELQESMQETRAAAASHAAEDKQGELTAILAEIDSTVSTIMSVGKVAMMCVSGVVAMGNSGFDVSKLVESNPNGYEPPKPKEPAATPDAPTPQHGGNAPGMVPTPKGGGTSINQPANNGNASINPPGTPAPAAKSNAPGDERTYQGPAKGAQGAAVAKAAASTGISLAGGPEAVLKGALRALESKKINVLTAEIKEEKLKAALAGAAQAAAKAERIKQEYITAMNGMIANVETLLTDKKNLENETTQLVGMAKQTNPNVAAALRIVTAGDKFLSQVGLTKRLGKESHKNATKAQQQRYGINGGNPGDASAPNQLKYWSADARPLSGADAVIHGKYWYTLHKNEIALSANGRDSVTSGAATNSTTHDVGAAVKELEQWEADVTAKRDQAQNALGMDAAAATPHR